MSSEITPHGWAIAPIESCLLPYPNGKRIRQGWSPQCKNHPAQSQDEWAVLKTSAIQDGYFVDSENKQLPTELEPRTHLEVESGDILITCAGPRARCGVACIVRSTRPRLLISGKMYQLRADPQIVDRHFLELYLRDSKTKKKIDEMKTGISDSGLNLTHDRFRALSIPLPPLAEQKRIVAKIEELFSELEAGEESLRLARRQLATYRQSLLKQAFEGKLTVKWREQTKAPPATESTLGRLVEIKSGNGFPKHLQGLEDGDYPFFKVGDISKNAQAGRRKLDRANNYISKETTKQIRGTIIPPNATVFAKIGAAVALNRRGLTKEPCLIDNNAMALIPGDKLDPEFLFLFMRQVDLGEKTRGGAVPSLRKGDLEEISIALPALPEQQEIVRLLDEQFEVIERNEREIDAALRRSEALRQAILKKAFTGKLVPQDPADEPATELLARIRAEREEARKFPTTKAAGKQTMHRKR